VLIRCQLFVMHSYRSRLRLETGHEARRSVSIRVRHSW
jgi:hypothetical protein